MRYTVNQLAKAAGLSVRTLHYYDEIGLLKPSFIHENGYRYYEDKEMLKLQQILFYRELEFPLEQIREIIHSKQFNIVEALNEHKKILEIKRKRITSLLHTIDTTVKSLKGGETMKTDDIYNGFDKKQMEEYKEEARLRWGHTDAYKQSQERIKNWTADDFKRVAKEGTDITQSIAGLMDKGIESEEVQMQIDRHYRYLSQFYECPFEMYRNLGKMYVEDKRFTAYYDKFRPGLAQFMNQAIEIYCQNHEK